MASKLSLIILFCAICCTLAVDEVEKKKTTTTTSTTSTTPSTTTSTTTTTEAPTTTPSTTTTSDPTTSSTTSSTTETPTTTTAAPPLPTPDIGEWNSTCIKARFAAQLSFSYNTVDNKTKQAKYNLPAKIISNVDSECNFNETESIVLQWVDNATKEESSFKLSFYKSGNSVGLGHLLIKLQPNTIFSDANNDTVQLIYNSNTTFITPLHMSYHCTREQTFNLTENINSKPIVGTITLSNVQLEAFHKDDEKNPTQWSFSSAKDCDGTNTPDIVPIAVGIALSALILIVFISYLVARRRSNVRGYMSF